MTHFLFPILYIILGSQQIPRLFLSLLFVLLQLERQMTVTVGSLFMSIFASQAYLPVDAWMLTVILFQF